MALSIKKLAMMGLGKKIGFLFTIQKIKYALILFDKTTKQLDKLEEKGHIGSWNSGKKFVLIKKINSKIVSKL